MYKPKHPSVGRARLLRTLVFAGAPLLLLAALLCYQIPAVHNRFDWRLESAIVYVRALVHPIQAVPTAAGGNVSAVSNSASMPAVSEGQKPTAPFLTPADTRPLATPTLSPASPASAALPPSQVLEPPPFEPQDWNNCGPVSLSMYLHYYGWEGDQYAISEQVKPMRDDRNVNMSELAEYVQNEVGWLRAIYRAGGDINLLRTLLSDGFPVLVEEAMRMDKPFWSHDDQWAGHYLLLTGYSDAGQAFITQDSFIGPDQKIDYAKLDANWQAFNRAYLIVYPPERENEIIKLLGDHWDVNANHDLALKAARQETLTQPKNPFAWFNLGSNLAYFERYAEAAQAYDKARELHIPQRMLRYQFGPFLAYFHSGRIDDLMTLTEYALTVTPNSEEALLWKGRGLYSQGHTLEARDCFEQALDYNPFYSEAQDALQFIQAK